MAPAGPGGVGAGSAGWWQPRPVLRRFVADLLQAELAQQRRSRVERPRPWSDELHLDQDLGVDSLERIALATALAESLHLHESGIEDSLLARRTLGDWVDIAEAGLSRFSKRLTFRTSGSSGTPKACPHLLAALQQETRHHAVLFAGRQRILCAVPGHHIYGFLFTVLLPRALGLPPAAVIDIRHSTPAWLARGAQSGDLVIGHPDFWQAVSRTVPAMPADVYGVTSTAPCPDAVSQAVEATGLARLIHIYGSSEAGGIGWRTSHRHPYRLLPHWRFADGSADLVRHSPEGEPQPFLCQDRLERLGAETFLVAGRNDEAVQVGGINVYPSRVVEVLRRHPDVSEVAVRLMRPDEGARLKAFVVPSGAAPDRPALLVELRRWVDAQLAVPERPKAIRIGERLPLSASGKLADWNVDAETDAGSVQRHW